VNYPDTSTLPDDAVAQIGELSQKHKLPVIGSSFGGAMWDRSQHAAVLQEVNLISPKIEGLRLRATRMRRQVSLINASPVRFSSLGYLAILKSVSVYRGHPTKPRRAGSLECRAQEPGDE
jgi:hypothetical protein